MAKHKKFQSIMPPHTPEDCEVRHVQPYQANKIYQCPYCNNTIEIGQGHKVVVPIEYAQDRRHFHSGCWTKYLASYESQLSN